MHLPRGMLLTARVVAVVLAMVVCSPRVGLTADDPAPGADSGPGSSPAPSRDPSYQRGDPASALRLKGEPPAIGDVILDDPLNAPGAIPGTYTCPTGRDLGEFVGEGYILKTTGPCRTDSTGAFTTLPPFPGLTVPDGEIHVEVKVVSGVDRASLFLTFRGQSSQDEPYHGYSVLLRPATGVAALFKEQRGVPVVPLASRSDLAGRISRDDWNDLAVRLEGPNIWVLLNGTLILSASDATNDRGWVAFTVGRSGEIGDTVESAAVFRNLRVSRLAAS